MPANRLDLFAQAPGVLLAVYLASAVDLYLFQAYAIPPLFGQVVVLGYTVSYLAVATLVSGARRLALGSTGMIAIALLALYTFWTVVSFLYSAQNDAVIEVLTMRVKAALFAMVFAFVFVSDTARNSFAWGAVGLAVLGSVLNIQDFILPTYSVVPGRAAGFYLNPNESGIMLIFLALIGSSRLKVAGTYLLWSLVAIAVLLTFSRGAWLFLFVAVAGLAVLGRLGGGRGRFIFILAIGIVLLFVLSVYLSGDLYVWAIRSSLGEYLDPNTLARLGAKGAEIDDYSAIERADVLELGMKTFLDSPFIGRGVGYTITWNERVSTHNMAVLLAAELGAVGVLIYFALAATLIARSRGIAQLLAVVFFGTGFFTHNQLDNIASVLVLAYIVAAADPSRRAVGLVRARKRTARTRFPSALPA